MNVYFVDTSVLCNLLQIPNMDSEREEVKKRFMDISSDNCSIFIVPIAVIIETGNHISHIADGNVRRAKAEELSDIINKSVQRRSPWNYYGKELTQDDVTSLSEKFVNYASSAIGMGDLSIINAYEKYKEEIPAIGHIEIWATDKHLSGYSEDMLPISRRNR